MVYYCDMVFNHEGDRMHSLTKLLLVLAAICAAMITAAPAKACSVPVFRYALERWLPDAYHVVVFHAGTLEGDAGAAVEILRQAEASGSVNLKLHVTDVNGQMSDSMRALWAGQSARVPWVVLLYPASKAGERHVWSGPLTSASARSIVSSPARRLIAERIAAGQTAVWVLIEPPGAAADSAAARVIDEQLRLMPGRLTLPPELFEEVPHLASILRVDFSLLRLSRDDPQEAVLLAMLLGSESDLLTVFKDEPVALPVYGRGRTLLAVVGRGIVADNILMACQFLTGRCSCEIKDENPGTDLLFDYPWQASLGVSLVDMVELPLPVGGFAEEQEAVATVPLAAAPPSMLLRNVLLAFGFIVVTVALGTVAALRKTRGRSR